MKNKDTITAEEFDRLFDEGEDISQFLDWSKAQRPLLDNKKRIPIPNTNHLIEQMPVDFDGICQTA